MTLLDVVDLHAGYGLTRVLHGISFGMAEGSITTLLGANGAGKTTTLRALCAMVRPQGEVRFDGERIDSRATEDIVRLGIAHVPEGRGTFVHLSTEENLRLGAYVRKDRAAVEQDFDRIYGYFPRLAERRHQQAGTLSGGEQQMLAVSRALMLRPRLLLLDEPSFGLAPLIVRELFEILRTINRRERVSILAGRAERGDGARPGRPRLPDRDRAHGAFGQRRRSQAQRRRARVLPRLLNMESFLHQVFAGLATGGIYASVALALVMIHQATHLLNFAQGEMAMFSTYIAWALINAGVPYWAAFFLTIGFAFVLGLAIQHFVMRNIRSTSVLQLVIVFIGLLVIFNSVAGWIFTYTIKVFPSPFPKEPLFGQKYLSSHELGAIGVTLIVLTLLWAFFRFTSLGLAMRAAAQNPTRAGSSASASPGCSRSAGGWPRRSARWPA